MPQLLGFAPGLLRSPSAVQALFVRGEASDYVLPRHEDTIRRLFPRSRIVELAQAGHWLHADQPAALVQLLAEWMEGPATGVPPPCLVPSNLGPAQAAFGPMFEPRAGA